MNKWINGTLALALYELWLLSFPLEGNLVSEYTSFNVIYFLIPHIISLFTIPLLLRSKVSDRILKIATLLLILFTILYPISDTYQRYILIFIGILSSTTVMRALCVLNTSQNTTISIGAGLAIGNFLVLILNYLPLNLFFKFLAIAILLIPINFLPIRFSVDSDLNILRTYLPFIYVFYLIGGIFYGFLLKEYARVAYMQGLELLFYIAFSLSGIIVIKRDRDLILALGILLGMLSFSLMKGEKPFLSNLSMFTMQSSLALMDFFVIFLIIKSGCSFKTIGYSIGVVSLALLSGNILSKLSYATATFLISLGNVILTISVLIFYFLGKKIRLSEYEKEKSQENAILTIENEKLKSYEHEIIKSEKIETIISTTQKRLSPKETEVLKLLILGKTYKEIGQKLGISESSVKTYVRRISEKLNVHGKEGLLKFFNDKLRHSYTQKN